MSGLPVQTIPEIDKDQSTEKGREWGKRCIDYGISLLDYQDSNRTKMDRLYLSYNGERSLDSIKWLTQSNGIEHRAKFVSYKVGLAKQKLLEGEWLRRPLNAVVQTVNMQAKSEKMAHMDFMTGAMIAKPELETIKQVAGVDVMEGAPIPESEDDPIWQKMSPKDKQEDIMQIIINEQIKKLGLIRKFGENFKDARITSKCFAKVEINQNGDVDYIWIDPRNAIHEYIDGDDFLEKSTIKGCRQTMPLHQALLRDTFTKTEREQLENAIAVFGNAAGVTRNRIRNVNKQTMIDVIHVEWKSVRPSYYKIMPKTPMQLEYDDSTSEITKEIPAEIYERNKAKYDKGVANGEFKIETKYEEDLWEGTCYGGIIYKRVQRKPFQMRRVDAPSAIMDSSYIGCLFGTTDGVRISLQELIENFDLAFDVCEYQIMKELNRAKGKVLGFDLAAMPKNKTLAQVIQGITDDGIFIYNSQAAGNVGQRNLDLQHIMQTEDIGFSDSFPQLIALQNNILNTLDKITGINENREGQVSASSTVTNTQGAIQASRTITEPLFYQMQLFVEKAMTCIVEATKVSWAFYKTEKGEQILGTDKFKYMQVTRELGYRDYGVHIEDGGKYLELMQRMRSYIEFAMNSKEISAIDALRFELAETTVEAEKVFEDAFQRVQAIAQQSMQQEQEAAAAMQQQQLQQQLQIATDTREDNQAAKINEIVTKGEVDIKVNAAKAQDKLIENQQQHNNDLLSEME